MLATPNLSEGGVACVTPNSAAGTATFTATRIGVEAALNNAGIYDSVIDA